MRALIRAAGAGAVGLRPPAPEPQGFQVSELLGGASAAGFARATEVRHFRFPADHGPHPTIATSGGT